MLDLLIHKTETIEVSAPMQKRKMISGTMYIPLIYASAKVASPLIITSDLHHNGLTLIKSLSQKLENPQRWIFISAGDMAGAGVMGSDGDATAALEEALENFSKVYFVQGNHDLESPYACSLKNRDGTFCHLHNKLQNIKGIGQIAGLDGVISRKKKLHRMPTEIYKEKLEMLLAKGARWIVTHETPHIPEVTNNSMGREELREIILGANIDCHIFGHCHFKNWHGNIGTTTFINVDSRIVFIEPQNLNLIENDE